jgi:molybdopterin synthase catalytic subunit
MNVTVLLFGACREAAGTEEWSCDLSQAGPNWTVNSAVDAAIARFPRLGPLTKTALFAVNEEHVKADHPITDGDTIAIFPPVSGGSAAGIEICEITREPIDKPGLEQRLLTGAAGAMVTFDGVVRNQTRGRRVIRLQYDAYAPMAVKEMQRIAAEVRERWPEIENIGIVHRFGELQISESSVVIAITSPHRKIAFEACRYAIDRLKQTVPIWKKEVFEDSEEWVEGEQP